MFSVVNGVIHRGISSVLWLATSMDGEGIWQSSRPLEAAKIFPSSNSAISSSSTSTSSAITILSRPAFARASTSATLFHTDNDPIFLDALQKPSTDNPKIANPMDCSSDHLLNRSVTRVEDDNFDKGTPIVPSTAVRWHRGRKASKNMARWMPDPLARGIRVNRPVTGVERLARLQRLGVAF
ncbi:hypothetical protein V8D89_008930 [Ganoderma adspersum]